jgi:hypothetical protein
MPAFKPILVECIFNFEPLFSHPVCDVLMKTGFLRYLHAASYNAVEIAFLESL